MFYSKCDGCDKFFANLSKDDQNEIQFFQPQNLLKFGGENPVCLVEKIGFARYSFGKKTSLAADIVERNIPLLTSKLEMKNRRLVWILVMILSRLMG